MSSPHSIRTSGNSPVNRCTSTRSIPTRPLTRHPHYSPLIHAPNLLRTTRPLPSRHSPTPPRSRNLPLIPIIRFTDTHTWHHPRQACQGKMLHRMISSSITRPRVAWTWTCKRPHPHRHHLRLYRVIQHYALPYPTRFARPSRVHRILAGTSAKSTICTPSTNLQRRRPTRSGSTANSTF